MSSKMRAHRPVLRFATESCGPSETRSAIVARTLTSHSAWYRSRPSFAIPSGIR
jgi:hypothetical protein